MSDSGTVATRENRQFCVPAGEARRTRSVPRARRSNKGNSLKRPEGLPSVIHDSLRFGRSEQPPVGEHGGRGAREPGETTPGREVGYGAVMRAAAWLWCGIAPWHPRDLIDIQGFIWVTCSEEYETWPWEWPSSSASRPQLNPPRVRRRGARLGESAAPRPPDDALSAPTDHRSRRQATSDPATRPARAMTWNHCDTTMYNDVRWRRSTNRFTKIVADVIRDGTSGNSGSWSVAPFGFLARPRSPFFASPRQR
jgi:hypothetical protein